MLNSKVSLSSKEWLDVIFDKRNKSYGAYELRIHKNYYISLALLFSATVFILLFLAPKIKQMLKGTEPIAEIERVVEVKVQPPPPVNPKTPPPIEIPKSVLPASVKSNEPPASKQNQIKFPPPIVKADELVHDLPPKINELKNADPGQRTIQGSPDGEIVITGAIGTAPKHAEGADVVGDNTVYNFNSIETQPQFPGGMSRFYAYLRKSVNYPEMAKDNDIQGKVYLSFVVEKNGSLTDIKVDRSLGGGTDEEAVRVLRESPRWIPGVQNGKAVRVKYNIPITFTLAQQ